jgi:hypothetical protein
MITKKLTMSFLVLMCLSLIQNITFGAIPEVSETEKQEYKQELAEIKAMRNSLTPGKTNNLEKYERFADEIQDKWKEKNKEHYAHLMLKVCGPLSSGNFKDDRRYEMARRYALAALEKPQEISVDAELELTGHVVTLMIGPDAPKGQIWEELRRKDVEIRLHAWRRLLDSIDPEWDPNEVIQGPNAVAAELGLPGSVDPQSIENPTLRAEYEAAIEANRQKIENYNEQNKLHKWFKRYPKRAEEYIVQAYSIAPYNNEELVKYLNDYKIDDETKARIVGAVTKNIEKQNKELEK